MIGAREAAMLLDGNYYSVHPAVIGRRIEVIADLARVQVRCDGKTVADHERIWAWHQTLVFRSFAGAGRSATRRGWPGP